MPADYFDMPNVDDGLKRSKVRWAEDVTEMEHFSKARLYVAGKRVPLYATKINFSHIYTDKETQRTAMGFASFFLEGKTEVAIQTAFGLRKGVGISPVSLDVVPVVAENERVVRFEISTPGQYVIDFGNDRAITLFVNEFPKEEVDPSDPSIMYFGPGMHDSASDSRIPESGEIRLTSHKKVHIADGAFVRARFIASESQNISFTGTGYIDGSQFKRTINPYEVHVPLEFNWCRNLSFKDIAILDPAGWCFNLYFGTEISLSNVKIVSSRQNGDGISLQSCQDVTVENCFVRSWDDSIVVKNYPDWRNRDIEGTTRSIKIRNSLIWTDLAQSMEVGYECVGETMEDILFENITVLRAYHLAPISIHNANNANVKDVTFKNITIEEAALGKTDGSDKLVDISVKHNATWSDQHKTTGLGSIDNVTIENVLVMEGIDNPSINVMGSVETRPAYPNEPHYVTNVHFSDFSLYGETLEGNYQNFNTAYSSNVTFSSTGKPITGHEIERLDVSSYGEGIDVIS